MSKKTEKAQALIARAAGIVKRKNRAGLPEICDLGEIGLAVVSDIPGAEKLFSEMDATQARCLPDYIEGMTLPSGAENARAGILCVILAVLAGDKAGYKRTLPQLREAVGELLTRNRAQWEGYAWQEAASFINQHRGSHGGGTLWPMAVGQGFDCVLQAGVALQLLARDLQASLEWYQCKAAEVRSFCQSERLHNGRGTGGDTPASYWAKQQQAHELPDSELAELVAQELLTQAQVDEVRSLPPIEPGRATLGEKIANAFDRLETPAI